MLSLETKAGSATPRRRVYPEKLRVSGMILMSGLFKPALPAAEKVEEKKQAEQADLKSHSAEALGEEIYELSIETVMVRDSIIQCTDFLEQAMGPYEVKLFLEANMDLEALDSKTKETLITSIAVDQEHNRLESLASEPKFFKHFENQDSEEKQPSSIPKQLLGAFSVILAGDEAKMEQNLCAIRPIIGKFWAGMAILNPMIQQLHQKLLGDLAVLKQRVLDLKQLCKAIGTTEHDAQFALLDAKIGRTLTPAQPAAAAASACARTSPACG